MATNATYALVLILGILFNLYIMALIARLLLQASRANPFNPITRGIINITKPLVAPCQRFLPTVKHFDFAILLVVLLITLAKLYIIAGIGSGIFLTNIFGVLIWAAGDIFSQLANLFFYGILIQVIASWVAAGQYSPGIEVVHHITSPLLRPIQRIIPSLGGFDISPIFALLLLKATEIIISWPLISTGRAIALS